MKKIIIGVGLLCFSIYAVAQDPVKWSFYAKKVSANTYDLYITASIASPWSIYSQDTPEGGPLPTQISFIKHPLLTYAGKVKEVGQLKKKYEDVFEVDVLYYSQKVEFIQRVSLKSTGTKSIKTNVTGNVEFMACNNEECLPPEKIPFTIALN